MPANLAMSDHLTDAAQRWSGLVWARIAGALLLLQRCASELRSDRGHPCTKLQTVLPALATGRFSRDLRRRAGHAASCLDGYWDNLSALANAQGGLERIKNTPLPRQYNQFPQVFTRVYCRLLPLGLVHDLTYLTPVGSTVIGFMFLALDRIGRDLEDPFENTLHDIPMQAITRTIEADLLQAIGSESVPAPVGVRDGVLW